MTQSAILRARMNPRRKAMTFALALDDQADILPPIEQVAKVWDTLDRENFSHLHPRRRR